MSKIEEIGGKKKVVRLNDHLVEVRIPKKKVSFKEGMKELNGLVEEIKKQKD